MTDENLPQLLNVVDVIPNDWNPNQMGEDEFSNLVKAIGKAESNFQQPILVRVHPDLPGKYQIVDGEHRYRASIEAGFSNVYAIVAEMDEKTAMLKTIAFNKFRGDPDNIKLAELLVQLRDSHGMTPEDIEQELGYTPTDL